MEFFAALQAVSMAGPLASRAFLPLFFVSLLATCPAIAQYLPLIPAITPPPGLAWIGSPYFLAGVGTLAVLELVAERDPEIKVLVEQALVYLKSAIAILISLALVHPATAQLLPAGAAPAAGGQVANGFAALPVATAVASGGFTWFIASQRARALGFLRSFDEDDSSGLQGWLTLLEDGWVLLAMLFVLILPIVALVLAGGLLLVVVILRRVFAAWETARRLPCQPCGQKVRRTALHCPHCRAERVPAVRLNWHVFGGRAANDAPLIGPEREAHQMRLFAARRCPFCAESVKPRDFLADGCPQCHARIPAAELPGWLARYQDAVDGRAYRLYPLLCLVGLLPVVGYAVALVLVRFYVNSPWRVLLGIGQRWRAVWLVRLVTFLLVFPAVVPVLSVVAVPAILWLNLTVFRRYGRAAASSLALPAGVVHA